jgi:hypothetical protein
MDLGFDDMHNYTGTPLLIIGNDKNKQLTLLSQRKLALTKRNTVHLRYKIIGSFSVFYLDLKLIIHVLLTY